jgi:hypothetical protein
MFGLIDKSKGILFATDSLDNSLNVKIQIMQQEVERLDENQFLNTSPDDLKRYLVQKYSVTPLTLLREQWYQDYRDAPVDVRHDRDRWIVDRSLPAMVAGERIEVRVPFVGESNLFYARPNTATMNPPRAHIHGNELVLCYESPADRPKNIRPLVDEALTHIEEYLGWQRGMIDAHNNRLPGIAEQAIQQRRARLLAQSQRAEALGIPIRRRDDAPKTYAVPTARKTSTPVLPPVSSVPFVPEPTWETEQYEQALKIMQDMTLVMERSPEAFKTMDEEALRQHFLVQLNGQFEGKATGETFNMSGKTDILLREGDRNVFIAECKFWKGPKAFSEAIDQLLSYATWRDSKTVILVFNRGTDTSTVLSGVDSSAKAHTNFKRSLDWRHESGFRYVLHANGDKNREVILTVLVFHIPKQESF